MTLDRRIQWDSHHGPAINVKDDSLYRVDLPETEAQTIWDMTAERFWEDANDRAKEHGYAGVWSEGRMGGWCVPYYPDNRPMIYRVDGYEPDEPEYRQEVKRFEAFGADIVALLEDYQAELRAELDAAVAERQDAAALLTLGTPSRGY